LRAQIAGLEAEAHEAGELRIAVAGEGRRCEAERAALVKDRHSEFMARAVEVAWDPDDLVALAAAARDVTDRRRAVNEAVRLALAGVEDQERRCASQAVSHPGLHGPRDAESAGFWGAVAAVEAVKTAQDTLEDEED